jgi:hypothetical protein
VSVLSHKQARPVRYAGPLRQDWYSFCSSAGYDPECPRCQAGSWRNVTVHRFDGLVWRYARPVALWWHNRPNSKSKRTLRRFFPGLR